MPSSAAKNFFLFFFFKKDIISTEVKEGAWLQRMLKDGEKNAACCRLSRGRHRADFLSACYV